MDELVKMVSDKTGISEDQSKAAVEVVINYLKGKLPAPIAGQLDGILGGEGGGLGGMAQGLAGNLFGKK